MTDKEIIWRDNYSRPNHNDEVKTDSFENIEYQSAIKELQIKHSRFVKISAAVFIIFGVLLAVLIFRGLNLADKNQASNLEKEFDRLEGDFMSLKKFIASKLDQAIKEMERDRRAAANQNSSPAKTKPAVQKEQKEPKPKVHKVQRGESLARIGKYYGLTAEQLRLYNNLDSNSIIHPGQELRLAP